MILADRGLTSDAALTTCGRKSRTYCLIRQGILLLMAQRTIVSFIDDLDGGEASQTVRFGLDGVEYEIDLSDENAAKLRTALAAYAEHGRKLSRSGRPYKLIKLGPSSQELRAWAKSHGYDVPNRGRIPRSIQDAYEKAHAA
jgi:Lsr2